MPTFGFAGSAPEADVLFQLLEKKVDNPDKLTGTALRKHVLKNATDAQRTEAQQDAKYTEAANAYPATVKAQLARTIVQHRQLAQTMDDNLRAFREHLASHLPELLHR